MHQERTFIAIKPEGIQRRFIGEIITKFEKKGLKLVAAKFTAPSLELTEKHYTDDEAWIESSGNRSYQNYVDKGIDPGKTPRELALMTRQRCLDHFTGRTIFAMTWEGPHAVQTGRKIAGHTNPLVADNGSIRGDMSPESYEVSDNFDRTILNIVHASGSVEEAEKEINLWFDKDEILDYKMIDEEIMIGKDWGKVDPSRQQATSIGRSGHDESDKQK
ncbi:MAG: nucleoside-diphosphate kinase [Patescibacteria group bacterium]|jgi:nucleoside-diphosphate kinase